MRKFPDFLQKTLKIKDMPMAMGAMPIAAAPSEEV